MVSGFFLNPVKCVCWWCGDTFETPVSSWCCPRCYPLKEQGYANAKAKGIKNYLDIEREVFSVLYDNGVFPDPSMPT